MYTITTTNRFNKDVKRCKKRGYDMSLLKKVMLLLSQTGKLPSEYKPHKLKGNYQGCWECHIQAD